MPYLLDISSLKSFSSLSSSKQLHFSLGLLLLIFLCLQSTGGFFVRKFLESDTPNQNLYLLKKAHQVFSIIYFRLIQYWSMRWRNLIL
jgi:hypothetical protein